MAYEPPRADRPGRLRAVWNRLRHPFGSTRDRDRGRYAPLLEAGTYPGSARSDTSLSRYSDATSEASTRPANAQPAGRQNGSDTLHVPPGGPFHPHPWSPLSPPERTGASPPAEVSQWHPLDSYRQSGTAAGAQRTGASPPAEVSQSRPLDSYRQTPSQSGIAAGAQTATIRPSPPQRHREQLAGPSSQQRATTPGRSAPPPALGG